MNRKGRPARQRLYRKRSEKVGLPPDSLVYVGDRGDAGVRVSLLDYSDAGVTEREINEPAQCTPYRDSRSVTWINVDGLSAPATVQALGSALGFHNLVLEDILNTEQRPKFEEFDGYLFLVAKMLEFDPQTNNVKAEHLALVLGRNSLVSLQEDPGDPFGPVRARIRAGSGKVRRLGADFLFYSLLDIAVDRYFAVLDQLGDRIEQLDHLILSTPSGSVMGELHALKRELLYVRKAVLPLRDAVSSLRHSESDLISETTVPYLRDLQDHIVQAGERIETYRELLTSMLELYLSSVGQRTNTVMKIVAIFSSIFLPLTFITGLFGMNFEFMPLLHSPQGFAVIVLSMVVIVLIMLTVFRWRRWL